MPYSRAEILINAAVEYTTQKAYNRSMTTMAMIYGLLPGWLSETCSSALLTHFGPKNRSSNWARRVHQVYPGSWNKSFKAACTEKYDGWLSTVEIHEETAAGNLRAPAPRKNYFAVDSWFFGRGHQKVSLKMRVEPRRRVARRYDSLPQGRTAL